MSKVKELMEKRNDVLLKMTAWTIVNKVDTIYKEKVPSTAA